MTSCSISNSIYGSNSEPIYHTGAGVIVTIHCEVELWDVDYPAYEIHAQRIISHSNVKTVPDVRINSGYVQTRWGIPGKMDNLTKRFTSEATDSIKQAYRGYMHAQ